MVDLNTASVQDIAIYAVTKIVEQKGRCVNTDNMCLYKSGDMRCAIGWLLEGYSEDVYKFLGPVRELRTAYDIPAIIDDNIDFFDELQKFHDTVVATDTSVIYFVITNLSKYIPLEHPIFQQWLNINNVGLNIKEILSEQL
jgi:hypothetical protein